LSIIPVVNLVLSRRRFAEAFQQVSINVMLERSTLTQHTDNIHGVTEPHGAGAMDSVKFRFGGAARAGPIESQKKRACTSRGFIVPARLFHHLRRAGLQTSPSGSIVKPQAPQVCFAKTLKRFVEVSNGNPPA